MLYLDRRLLGTILIEEADESFEGLHLTHPQNVSYDAPPNVKADESRRASRATPNLQQEHELARFLEDTYRGAGPYARDFLSLVRCPTGPPRDRAYFPAGRDLGYVVR